MYYYYGHVYYALFRPIEVARVQIKHINLDIMLIDSETKTGDYFKQIPKILIDEFYNKIVLLLSQLRMSSLHTTDLSLPILLAISICEKPSFFNT